MRRFLALTTLLALAFASAADAKPSAPSWAQADIRLLVSRGLLSRAAASRPDGPLTQTELATLVSAISPRPVATPVDPQAPVTIAQLDAKLVAALRLTPSASTFFQTAKAAGLKPPSHFGTETVARLLGLRINHPAADDARELRYDDPATRAEAAYSVGRILKFGGWETESVSKAASTFVLPTLDPWQKRVLTTAASLLGMPYIWGGTSDRPQAPQGVIVPGGFDCSGFTWRVFKQPYPGGTALAAVLKGRTAAAMAGEVSVVKRIPFAKLRPADVVFFGPAGPRSKLAQIDHVGIALGNGWMIHSSRFGVALTELTGWYKQHFAWGRRPLAEAKLGTGAALIPPGIQ